MEESVLGRDFEHWIALSDAYARQISKLRSDGAASSSEELSQLAHDLKEMESDFQPMIDGFHKDLSVRTENSPAGPDSVSD